MKKLGLCLALLIASATGLFAWGDQGHKGIWTVAQEQLTPKAKQRINQILAGDKLPMTAVWLDRVRDAKRGKGPLLHDADAASLNTQFPANSSWHFVDLPLGSASYQDGRAFTSPDDVVQRINFCIAVLEGTETSLDQRSALRTLIHLVGDVHQPLHCASGFYDITDLDHPALKRTPTEALPFKENEDRGGNQLFFGDRPFDELHGFWDGNLVKDVAGGSSSVTDLAEVLGELVATVDASTPGDHHSWAEKWAAESVKLADKAYAGIQFGKCTPRPAGSGKGTIDSIAITLPADYEETQQDVAASQLAKASLRLAALLNKIFE